MSSRNVTLSARSFPPAFRGGGPSRSLAAIAEHLSSMHNVRVITAFDDYGFELSELGIELGRWEVRHGARCLNLPSGLAGLRQQIGELRSERSDALYLSSLMDPMFSFVPLVLLRLGIATCGSVVVSPRGELDPGALATKTRKKALYFKVVRLLGLVNNVVWHATTEVEALQIREHFGEDTAVLVAANIASPPIATTARSNCGTRAVFVSRIDDKKNLATAIEALSHSPKTSLTVIGPVHSAQYWETCLDLVNELGLSDRFHYAGELKLGEVSSALTEFDLFIFPTLGENFGHVILEALAARLPVLLSNTTPWGAIESAEAGWILEPTDASGFGRRLVQFADMSEHERLRMMSNAVALAQAHIDNPSHAEATSELFEKAWSK